MNGEHELGVFGGLLHITLLPLLLVDQKRQKGCGNIGEGFCASTGKLLKSINVMNKSLFRELFFFHRKLLKYDCKLFDKVMLSYEVGPFFWTRSLHS